MVSGLSQRNNEGKNTYSNYKAFEKANHLTIEETEFIIRSKDKIDDFLYEGPNTNFSNL